MPEHMYRQIAEDIRHKIESGEFSYGALLPGELELREQYDASRNTIRDAVKWLISRGLVETRPGEGTFVVKIDPFVTTISSDLGTAHADESDAYLSAVEARSRRPRVTPPRVEIQYASGAVADGLQIDDGSMVVSRHQQRYIDDTPWSLQTTFYPERLVHQGATHLVRSEDMPTGTMRYLSEAFGIKQVGLRDKIIMRMPDASEAAFFLLPDDGRVPVFEIQRTAYDGQGRPIRLTVTTYPADRNQFVLNIGDVPFPS